MRRVAYLKNGASQGALARNNASYRFRPALSRGNSFAVQSMTVCDELQGMLVNSNFLTMPHGTIEFSTFSGAGDFLTQDVVV